MGCGPVVGPDRDHGRCDIGGLFGLLRCRGGHDEHVPRARRGDRRKRAVLLALRRSGLALLAHARGRRRSRTTRPRSAGPWRHRVDRGLFVGAMFTLPPCASPGSPPWPRPIAFSRSSSGRRTTPLRPPGRGHRLGLRGFCRHARGHPLRPGGPRRRGRQHRVKNRTLQIRPITSRRRSGCTNIPTATWPSSTDPGVWRATAPTAKPSTTTGSRPRDPLRRDRARACG